MEKTKRLKEFLLDTIIIGGLVGIVTYATMNYKNEQLKHQLRTPHTTEQKVEFNLPYSKGLGWTDPQNQRIYFKEDIDNDGLLDTYYIENPFSKNNFRINIDYFGKDQLPREE